MLEVLKQGTIVTFIDSIAAMLARIIQPTPRARGLLVVNCFYHEVLTNTGGHG
jgi:hypothetical protein